MDHWDVKVGIISRCCLFCYCKQPEDTIWSPRYKLKLGEWRMKPPQIFSPYFPTTGSHTSSTDKPWAAVRTMLTETRQTLTNIIGLSSWFCRTFLVHREGFIFLYSAVARKHLWGRGRGTVCVIQQEYGKRKYRNWLLLLFNLSYICRYVWCCVILVILF